MSAIHLICVGRLGDRIGFACVVLEHCSEAVHIYAFPRAPAEFKPALRTVMQQRSPVRTARWSPGEGGRASSSLVACTGSGGLYMWRDSNPEWMNDEEAAECVGIPGSTSEFIAFIYEVVY